jgi:predicted lipid-binding transport protein (Tim44 family)
MDELALLRMLGVVGSGMDVTAIVAFVAFGVIYFLAPLVTRTRERPAALAASLYLLIGYAAISLVLMVLQWSEMMNGVAQGFGMPGRGNLAAHIVFGVNAVKTVVFLLAMIAFVIGLQAMPFKDAETQAFEQAVEKLQQLRDENLRLRKRLEREAARDDAGTHDGM